MVCFSRLCYLQEPFFLEATRAVKVRPSKAEVDFKKWKKRIQDLAALLDPSRCRPSCIQTSIERFIQRLHLCGTYSLTDWSVNEKIFKGRDVCDVPKIFLARKPVPLY